MEGFNSGIKGLMLHIHVMPVSGMASNNLWSPLQGKTTNNTLYSSGYCIRDSTEHSDIPHVSFSTYYYPFRGLGSSVGIATG
jgi:hypothetical protein